MTLAAASLSLVASAKWDFREPEGLMKTGDGE